MTQSPTTSTPVTSTNSHDRDMIVGYARSTLESFDLLPEVDQIASAAFTILQRFKQLTPVEAYEIVLEAKGFG